MMNFSMHFMLVKPSEYTANTTETCSQNAKTNSISEDPGDHSLAPNLFEPPALANVPSI